MMKTDKWKYPKVRSEKVQSANNRMFAVESALDNGVEFNDEPRVTRKARVEIINGKKFYVM